MPKLFRDKDVEEANEILAGNAPAQSKKGVMTPGERIASIGRAFGAKAPEKKKVVSEVETTEETKMAKGGKVSSASKRADGIAIRGKTKGTMVMMSSGGKCR